MSRAAPVLYTTCFLFLNGGGRARALTPLARVGGVVTYSHQQVETNPLNEFIHSKSGTNKFTAQLRREFITMATRPRQGLISQSQ